MPRTPNLASGSTQSQALGEGTVLLGCPLVHRVTQGTVHTLWDGLGPDTMVLSPSEYHQTTFSTPNSAHQTEFSTPNSAPQTSDLKIPEFSTGSTQPHMCGGAVSKISVGRVGSQQSQVLRKGTVLSPALELQCAENSDCTSQKVLKLSESHTTRLREGPWSEKRTRAGSHKGTCPNAYQHMRKRPSSS